ncbi:UPF0481 protein At3g47200-like [Cucumis melo]|uniref:UPF0481 protein At3g47200-like n=1 Tax=Cucumis melo TaxID=3656 RepID=A0A1S4DUV4_CUCME|nr:UPF0481 protein At3g47200-like [Cucumis melo]
MEAIGEEIDEVNFDICDKVEKSMGEMLEKLPPLHKESSIYRVPKQQREMNPKVYLPQFISIGPYHYKTQENLKANEQYKFRAFIKFLYRMINRDYEYSQESLKGILKAGTLKHIVKTSHCWTKQVWNSYASSINMKEEEFIIMMLVDACFIIDFLLDPSFYIGLIFDIYIDLIKLENQLPLFLLQRLAYLLPITPNPCFPGLVIARISGISDIYTFSSMHDPCDIEPKHFVDYLNFYFPQPLYDMTYNKQQEENYGKKKSHVSFIHPYFCDFWNKMIHCAKNEKKKKREKRQMPPSITELWEAGVTIKKAENPKSITSITFKSGVLEIPHLNIHDSFEILMRNLIAFEQFSDPSKKKTCVIEYILFLDHLISTEKDVRLLVKVGVINNSIGGSDKEVSDLFNDLCKYVTISKSSPYTEIINNLCEHCDEWWNRAMASLIHNYFNTPWAIISFFAGALLLILTLLQTIFSAISAFPT